MGCTLKRVLFYWLPFFTWSLSTAEARQVHFTAVSTSNTTVDVMAHPPACQCNGQSCTCSHDLFCSITITNLSNVLQKIDDWRVDFSTLNANWTVPNPSPTAPFGNIQYSNSVTFISNTNAVSFAANSNGLKMEPYNPGTNLLPFGIGNDSVTFRVKNTLTYNWTRPNPFIVANSPLNQNTPRHNPLPINRMVKATHICTGSITVNDSISTSPGFVSASGQLDYVGDSYQNPQFESGVKTGEFDMQIGGSGCAGHTNYWPVRGTTGFSAASCPNVLASSGIDPANAGNLFVMRGLPNCTIGSNGNAYQEVPPDWSKDHLFNPKLDQWPIATNYQGCWKLQAASIATPPDLFVPSKIYLNEPPYGFSNICSEKKFDAEISAGSLSNKLDDQTTFDSHTNWQTHVLHVPVLVNGGKPF